MRDRIIGIDIARGFAILLVTWKHSMASFGARGELQGWAHFGLEFVMQLATPIFLILFGAMLELVYRPRFERGLERDTARRLYKRSLQCYGYYCLAIVVFFVVMGTYSWMSLPLVFTGFISVPYSHLLAFYTAALALAPLLIIARIKFGLLSIVGSALLIQALHPVISHIPAAPELFERDYLQHMSGFLYGKGVDFMGPSLIHGLSLVGLGMLFGYGLQPNQTAAALGKSVPTISICMALGCVATIALCIIWQAPLEAIHTLISAELRITSHPLYFAIGTLGAICVTWLFIALNDIWAVGVGRSLRVFGRRSLFAFGIGNILAHVAPPSLTSLLGLWGCVIGLFGLVCGLTLIYDQVEKRQALSGIVTSIRNGFSRLEQSAG
ncbi:MAG: OpgC domain-containing protein [Pseudomonadota bacterium]